MTYLRLIDDCEREGALHMALDEVLFRACMEQKDECPVLRFYRFRGPTVTVGYGVGSQHAERETFHTPVVRRITGGGLVMHGEDLTYSLILSLKSVPQFREVQTSYRLIHSALRDALGQVGVAADLYSDCGPKVSDAYCFRAPVSDDVMAGPVKLAGAGQKRSRFYLLHQGSIAWNIIKSKFPGISEGAELELRHRFAARISKLTRTEINEIPITAEELRKAETRVDDGYAGKRSR